MKRLSNMSVHQAAIIETLKDQSAVVTGGSRRLGLGLVEALVELGARVTVIAREEKHLTVLRERLRVVTFAGYHRSSHRKRVLKEASSAILVLNAGAIPPKGPRMK